LSQAKNPDVKIKTVGALHHFHWMELEHHYFHLLYQLVTHFPRHDGGLYICVCISQRISVLAIQPNVTSQNAGHTALFHFLLIKFSNRDLLTLSDSSRAISTVSVTSP